jgi:hypothetical protein
MNWPRICGRISARKKEKSEKYNSELKMKKRKDGLKMDIERIGS